MANIIISAIIVVMIVIGVREALKHFKGQGGCCGGGTYKLKPKKLQNVADTRTVLVDGMSCEHCENRVREAINDLPGMSAARVSHKKGVAVINGERTIDEAEIRAAIKKAGYMVREIK